jgi:hypothetical protein
LHTNQNPIAEFLLNLKLILAAGNAQDERFIFVTSRKKNTETLLELGITPTQVKQVILDLTTADYKAGPEKDDDPAIRGSVWIFNKEIQGVKIYIKLSVKDDRDYRCVRCISFHPSETA